METILPNCHMRETSDNEEMKRFHHRKSEGDKREHNTWSKDEHRAHFEVGNDESTILIEQVGCRHISMI